MVSLTQLLYLAVHPNQLRSILQWKLWHDPVHARDQEKESPTLRECFKYLTMTSRSFSSVIQELNPKLLVPCTLFYLILRGLDTIEDDMTIPIELKEPLLRNFHKILDEEGWNFNGNGPNEKDRELLVHFNVVIFEFNLIDTAYKKIIVDITDKMGNGMADYALNAEHNINGVNTIKDYENYCHYVAGLVGDGLTRLFVESGFANPALLQCPKLAESMGQFLQKTNIIRDIREDFDDQRRFWPKEIWSNHVEKFDDLFEPANQQKALNCSSEMVLNALSHVEDCLFYMAGIRDQSVFNFVAIPQSMAIATLELVFQNPKIFDRNVKLSKGDACQLMMDSSKNQRCMCEIFRKFAQRIHKKNTPRDPNFLQIGIACAKIEKSIETLYPSHDPKILSLIHQSGTAEDIARKFEATKDFFYFFIAVFGTILVLSIAMVGAAYLAGARSYYALEELKKLSTTQAPRSEQVRSEL